MELSAACAGAEAARSRLQDLRARIERAQAARRRAGLTELQERETALAAAALRWRSRLRASG